MSRKLLSAAAVLLFLAPHTTAHAQVGYGVAAGFSSARGDFGNVADNGFHITGLVNVGVPLSPLGFRGEVSFSEFAYKASLGLPSNSKARIMDATANAVFSPPGLSGMYLIGGIGAYHSSTVCDGCTATATKIGYNGGIGYKWGLSGFGAFVEARYHYIPGANDPTNGGVRTSSTRFVPISFGVIF